MLSGRLTVDSVRRKWETEAMNGMFWFQLVVIVALLAAVGWLAVGGGGHMSEPMQDRPDLALPRDGMLGRHDVDRVRFSVGARGYRMDEVDDVLDRLAHEIDARERRIAELEGRAPEGEEGDAGSAFEATIPRASEPEPGESEDEDSAATTHADTTHSDPTDTEASQPEASHSAGSNTASNKSPTSAASNGGAPGITGSADSDPAA
jgi:DivIVA domain-containing protein